MLPALVAIAARQGGVFTRQQALEVGETPRVIRTLTRPNGPWVVVRRGVYADREAWEALDEWATRPVARDWAAHLTMTREHVLSHDSAGRAYGLSTLRTAVPLIHITRPGVGGSRTEHGVKHHLSQGLPWQSSFTSGLPVTPLARTALDIAREHGLWHGVAAIDSALRQGAEHGDFARHLGPMRHWPHVTKARTCLALGDPGAENAGESMARLLLLECDVPEVRTQFPIQLVTGRVAWADLVVGNHVVEFDGRAKYVRLDTDHASTQAGEIVWAEKERERLIRAEGLGVSRLVWSDFWGAARTAARARLRSEIALTQERFGSSRPAHLEDFADRLADVRRRRMAAN